jgi:hypothetical protein
MRLAKQLHDDLQCWVRLGYEQIGYTQVGIVQGKAWIGEDTLGKVGLRLV